MEDNKEKNSMFTLKASEDDIEEVEEYDEMLEYTKMQRLQNSANYLQAVDNMDSVDQNSRNMYEEIIVNRMMMGKRLYDNPTMRRVERHRNNMEKIANMNIPLNSNMDANMQNPNMENNQFGNSYGGNNPYGGNNSYVDNNPYGNSSYNQYGNGNNLYNPPGNNSINNQVEYAAGYVKNCRILFCFFAIASALLLVLSVFKTIDHSEQKNWKSTSVKVYDITSHTEYERQDHFVGRNKDYRDEKVIYYNFKYDYYVDGVKYTNSSINNPDYPSGKLKILYNPDNPYDAIFAGKFMVPWPEYGGTAAAILLTILTYVVGQQWKKKELQAKKGIIIN